MRAFICLVVAVFAAVVAASSSANPFKNPNGGYTFTVGQPTTLKWTPTTSGTVSLLLQHGSGVTTASDGTPIASGIDNSGTYTWTVPSDVSNEVYTIEIISDSNPNDYNFLPSFVVNGATGASSSSAAPSSSSAAMTSTSAEPTTTTTSESMSTTMTTMTTSTSSTSTSTSTSTDSSSSASATSSESSSSSSSAPSSSAPVPTTNAGIANRVSGGMLAVVAGAIAVM